MTTSNAELLDQLVASTGSEWRSRAAEMASATPGALIGHARRFSGAEAAAILMVLPTHWHRIAFAGAAAPWDDVSRMEAMLLAERDGWPTGDLDAVLRAMTGTDRLLNRPQGIDDHRVWCIVDGEPFRYALWRSDDDIYALEVVTPGWSLARRSRRLSATDLEAIQRGEVWSLIEDMLQRRKAVE